MLLIKYRIITFYFISKGTKNFTAWRTFKIWTLGTLDGHQLRWCSHQE